jgi:hypothetical protein
MLCSETRGYGLVFVSFKGDQGVAYGAVIGTGDDERVYNLAGPLPMKILSWREVR